MPLIERVLDRHVCVGLADYLARGGGSGLDAARRLGSEGIVDEVEAAGLRGRGGGGFPTGIKLRTVAAAGSAEHPTTVVVNAAEGEPGTFKDRELLRVNPFKVIEGAAIAAVALGAPTVIIAMKRSFEREVVRVRQAIAEVEVADWLPEVTIKVVEGPDEYLFGEETALLEVVEGRPPFPRITPPYRRGVGPKGGANPASEVELAVLSGGGEAPALVDNVETMANLSGLLANGADWFRAIGTPQSPGTLICTMSGRCRRHAIGEVPMGTPLSEAISLIGMGPIQDHRIVAAMSGVANPVVPEDLLDTPLSYEAMAAIGSGLGAGGFFLFDETVDLVAVAYAASRFLAVESCGQCEGCKRDGLAISDRLGRISRNEGTQRDLDQLPRLLVTVTKGARCFLASQQERVVSSVLRLVPELFAAHLVGSQPPAERAPIMPIVDIEGNEAVLELSYEKKQPDWTFDVVDSGATPAERLGSVQVGFDGPHQHEAQVDVTEALSPRDRGPDPLQPLVDLDGVIRESLERLRVADDESRPDVVHELRRQLEMHDDLTQRIVHPLAQKYAGVAADDLTWYAEREEARAEQRLRHLDSLDSIVDETEVPLSVFIDGVHEGLERHEQQIIELLRARMDPQQLVDLGNAIAEACSIASA